MNRDLISMVDAAMIEMQDINPPLRRSECERLIAAAMSAQVEALSAAQAGVPAPVLDSLLNIVIKHEARATPEEVRSMAAELATYRAARTQADSVLEDAGWMPLTPELLTAIESGDHGERFWLAAPSMSQPQIGDYEWRQGWEPHGFNTGGGRWSAGEITHVLPYKPPVLPAARKQGAKHDNH